MSFFRKVLLGLLLAMQAAFSGVSTAQPTAAIDSIGRGGPSALPRLHTLQPGAFREISQALQINVVFVGIHPAAIWQDRLVELLPKSHVGVHRIPLDYFGVRQPTGNRFSFRYNMVMAGPDYADRLFEHLGSLAVPQPRTWHQDFYNQAAAGAIQVGQNHWIDASKAERWLAEHPPTGVDTRNPTIYLLNWYGRRDFHFHVYTKTDDPDPDTGFNPGLTNSFSKMVAWGGTPTRKGPARRVWFYDFSAGPEAWGGSYDIVSPDLDGDGQVDYRIPMIWDYGNPRGSRPFNDLTGDVARLLRYVAINQLITPAPIYSPAINSPRQPGRIHLGMNVLEGIPAFSALPYLKPARVVQEVASLQRHQRFTSSLRDQPFTPEGYQAYLCFAFGPSCYGNQLNGNNFGDLFLYYTDHLSAFLTGKGDYEAAVFVHAVQDSVTPSLMGYADFNWYSGAQSYVYTFTTPQWLSWGYGITSVVIHELGHHLGLSHVGADGYDSELDLPYSALGDLYFAWTGDEVNSVMSYLTVSNRFSQFDQDSMDRWHTAAYINQSNQLLLTVAGHARAREVTGLLRSADADAAAALMSYRQMEYAEAALQAKSAHSKVTQAVASLGVAAAPMASAATALPQRLNVSRPKQKDRIERIRQFPH